MTCPECAKLRELVEAKDDHILTLTRQKGRLKGELTKLTEGTRLDDEARKLFDHFVEKLSKPKTFRFGDKRQALLQKALAQWGWDECARAIDGLALKPYWGRNTGRTAEQVSGSVLKADVDHALSDEQRLERCIGYIEEAEARTFAVIAEDCKATLARTEGYRPDDYEEQVA